MDGQLATLLTYRLEQGSSVLTTPGIPVSLAGRDGTPYAPRELFFKIGIWYYGVGV
jgi:hypothetical protein